MLKYHPTHSARKFDAREELGRRPLGHDESQGEEIFGAHQRLYMQFLCAREAHWFVVSIRISDAVPITYLRSEGQIDSTVKPLHQPIDIEISCSKILTNFSLDLMPMRD